MEKNCWNGKEIPVEDEMIKEEQKHEIIGERQKRRKIMKINKKDTYEKNSEDDVVSVNVKVNTGGGQPAEQEQRRNQPETPQGRVYVQVEISDKNGQALPPDR